MDLTLCIKERFQEVFLQKIKQLGMKPEAPRSKDVIFQAGWTDTMYIFYRIKGDKEEKDHNFIFFQACAGHTCMQNFAQFLQTHFYSSVDERFICNFLNWLTSPA